MEKRSMTKSKYWTETTEHWTKTIDGSYFSPMPTAADGPPPVTTADPNSLGELMRYAIFLPGDPFPYDPKTLIKGDWSIKSD